MATEKEIFGFLQNRLKSDLEFLQHDLSKGRIESIYSKSGKDLEGFFDDNEYNGEGLEVYCNMDTIIIDSEEEKRDYYKKVYGDLPNHVREEALQKRNDFINRLLKERLSGGKKNIDFPVLRELKDNKTINNLKTDTMAKKKEAAAAAPTIEETKEKRKVSPKRDFLKDENLSPLKKQLKQAVKIIVAKANDSILEGESKVKAQNGGKLPAGSLEATKEYYGRRWSKIFSDMVGVTPDDSPKHRELGKAYSELTAMVKVEKGNPLYDKQVLEQNLKAKEIAERTFEVYKEPKKASVVKVKGVSVDVRKEAAPVINFSF